MSWGNERKIAEEMHQVESSGDRGDLWVGLRWDVRQREREARRRENRRPIQVCKGRSVIAIA